jgi:hypothetical protein
MPGGSLRIRQHDESLTQLPLLMSSPRRHWEDLVLLVRVRWPSPLALRLHGCGLQPLRRPHGVTHMFALWLEKLVASLTGLMFVPWLTLATSQTAPETGGAEARADSGTVSAG